MEIFQTKTARDNYRTTIISEKPFLVTYHDLIGMVDDIEMDSDGIAFCLRHDDCPTPINHDDSIDGEPEDGIWVRDRLMAFFFWMTKHSAWAERLTHKKPLW